MRFTCFRMIYNEQSMFSLYVIIMSHTSFRVNPHSRVCLNVKEPLAWSRSHIWSLSDSNVIRTHNHLVWLSGWAYVYELSGCGFQSRCCHLKYVFLLENKLYFDLKGRNIACRRTYQCKENNIFFLGEPVYWYKSPSDYVTDYTTHLINVKMILGHLGITLNQILIQLW